MRLVFFIQCLRCLLFQRHAAYPKTLSFFFFFLSPSAVFPFCKALQLPILCSLVASHFCSCSLFLFLSSISSSSFFCCRPSSCICTFICLRLLSSSSISTCLVFSRHALRNSLL